MCATSANPTDAPAGDSSQSASTDATDPTRATDLPDTTNDNTPDPTEDPTADPSGDRRGGPEVT